MVTTRSQTQAVQSHSAHSGIASPGQATRHVKESSSVVHMHRHTHEHRVRVEREPCHRAILTGVMVGVVDVMFLAGMLVVGMVAVGPAGSLDESANLVSEWSNRTLSSLIKM